MENPLYSKQFLYKSIALTTILFFCINLSFAQPLLPQKTLTVTATQAIHFGTLSASGAGGTVSVGWDGSRVATGDIILLATAPSSQPAIFEIKLCQGRNVIITYDATTILTGSAGGSLVMEIGPTERGINGVSFTTNNDCNFVTPLRVGATLHIPGNPISGTYTGAFAITFNQE